MELSISSNFDAGNIRVISIEEPQNIQLKIEKDTNSEFLQWFYFRLQGAKETTCRLNIINAGNAAYPEGWEDYKARASYDRITWFQIPTGYKDGILSIDLTPEFDSIYIAYFAPFSYEQHLDLINNAQLSPLCTLDSIGETTQGRPIDFLKVGNDDINKKKLWVIARQHPGETMAEWFMLGLIGRILDEEDASSVSLLEKANLYLVPNMNIDGSMSWSKKTGQKNDYF